MSLLNDTEKVTFLIHTLDHHIHKLPTEDSARCYLESIRSFLKTEDSILQKAAYANSELFIDNLAYELANQITYKRAIGALIASFEKIGFFDSMDAAAIILEFEQILKKMSPEEAERIYQERWVGLNKYESDY